MVRASQRFLSLLLAGLIAGLTPASAFANPAGGVVQGGSATIAGQGTGTVTVNQTSSSAVLSWQSFNIAPGETTNFVQPSVRALALNRILDGQASSILGNLNANGRVYLINPNGILFGQSAVVNVGGIAAATNAQVTNLVNAQVDALASAQGAPGASITNAGHINAAPGGDVYLVGARVENSSTGVIHVDGGTVKVASGAILTLAGEDGVGVEYQVPTTPDNTAVNLGQILADRGIVDIRASIVRQAGTVQASAAVEHEGQIVLVGDSELDVSGETATQNGDIQASSGGDVVIGAGGALRSETGNVDVEAGRDVLFTSTDKTRDSVVETGSGNIRVAAERDVNLQPNVNAAGNTAIRTRGIDVEQPDGSVVHEKGDGGSVVVIARTGNVNSGTADRWIDSSPPLDPTFFDLFGVDYPSNYDPIPVDPRGILGIGSEAGGDVTVIAGGNVSTRRSDVTVTRTGGSATATPPSDPDAPLPIDYDGSHIGVFGQAYEAVQLPTGLFPTDSVRIPVAGAPLAKLTVIAGGDISGDYMIRNGTASLRAGYSLDPSGLDQIAADPSALAAIEANTDPTTRLIHLSDLAMADPARGWLGALGSPITLDMAFASVDGRGANGIALRAAENPSLVYPSANNNVNGTAKSPLYGEDDSLTLDAERGDVVLLGTDDVIREAGSTATTSHNPFVRMLPPSVSITTHEFTRGGESRGGDLVLLNDFQILPSQQGGLSLDVAGEVRTAGVAATGKSKAQITAESFGLSGDQNFTLQPGLKLRDTATGAEYTLDSPVLMQERQPPQAAHGSVQFTFSPAALASGVTIPAGTTLVSRDGKLYTTDRALVVPPPAERQRATEVRFVLDQPRTGTVTLSSNVVKLKGPDGAIYDLDKDVTILPGQTFVVASVHAEVGGGADLRIGQLQLSTGMPGLSLSATNVTISTRKVIDQVTVTARETGSAGNILPGMIAGLVTPIPGVVSARNPGQLSGGIELAEFGTALGNGVNPPTVTAVSVIGPAGAPPNGSTLVVEPGQSLPAGISADDIVITAGQRAGGSDALVPAVFRSLQVTRDDAGNVVSTRVDPAAGEIVILDPSRVWTSSASANPPLAATAHITQSRASPDIEGRGGRVFDYAAYYSTCRAGTACQMTDPVKTSPNGAPLPTLLRGTGPTHANNPSPALLLAHGGYDRVGFDLAEAATVWSGADVVDLQLKAQNTSDTDLTQIVVPYGNARFGAGTETLVDNQLGFPVEVQLPDDPASGLNVSGPGRARILVGVAPHVTPIEGFDGPLADLVPAPVDPGNLGIRLADWHGSAESFTGLDERGKVQGTGDGVLFASEAPWVPTARDRNGDPLPAGRAGKLELDDVGGNAAEPLILGLLTSGNASDSALPSGGAELQVVTAGDVLMHRFGVMATIQGGDLVVESVTGKITADQPPSTYGRQRGFLTMNAAVTGSSADNQAEGGGDISLDASGDVFTGGSAVAALSGSDISIETRTGSIVAGRGTTFTAPTVRYDPVTGTPQISYRGAGVTAPGGNVRLKARRDINLGAGIRARGIQLNAGGNVTAGTGSAQATTISIDAGGTIAGSFTATSISIGSGALSSAATVSAGVVSGGGGVVSNTGANQVSAGGVIAGTSPQVTSISETAAGTAQAGLRTVIIDISSRPCESQECR